MISQIRKLIQDKLVSGVNIKTINGSDILGPGNLTVTGTGVSDGDKGDITVSSSGTVWTIDNLAVTNAKINDVAATKVTTDSTHRFVTDAQLTVIGNTSGINTGDQTSIIGITGSRDNFDTACTDGNFLYVGDIVDAVADGSTKGIASFTANDFNSSSGNISIDYTNGQSASGSNKGFLTSGDWTTFNNKQAALTAGYGITGIPTPAVSLTNAQAFCTAETTLSAATYADITGASITLAAGTWLILATINASSQSTTVTVINAAITDAANTVIVEGAQHIVAGTATVRTWGNVSLSAIVTPGVSTTYKLRGARGTTTQTGNVIVSDGTGVNTANNVSNNSDKSTSIRAIRIA